MEIAEKLNLWGIHNVDDMIYAAAQANLPIHIAAALLEQESGGGRNVWGSDPVSTGGVYVKGSVVTRESYLAYKAIRHIIGNQGAGPNQLTSSGYQDQADALGGCWVPRYNMIVGFRAMADLMNRLGFYAGLKAYNGSGPMADRYREQMLTKITKWGTRLGTTTVVPAPNPTLVPPRVEDTSEDEPMADIPLKLIPELSGQSFRVRGGTNCEAGSSSAVVDAAWCVCNVFWGSADLLVSFRDTAGKVMGPASEVAVQLSADGRRAIAAPDGVGSVTVDGHAYGQDVVVSAVLMFKNK